MANVFSIPFAVKSFNSLYTLQKKLDFFYLASNNSTNNLSGSLLVLNLQNNSFHGTIPQTFTNGSKLGMINLSQNQLHSQVPRSLANCKMLGILNLGNNKINDTFSCWLRIVPKLRVLILWYNEFYSALTWIDVKREGIITKTYEVNPKKRP